MPKKIGKVMTAEAFDASIENLGINDKYTDAAKRILVDGEPKFDVRHKTRLDFNRLHRTCERIQSNARRMQTNGEI